MSKLPRIVVIGGGTGTFTVLSGLKKYPLSITAVITSFDSGGSSGRLRDEFGYLPVGDFRQALTALGTGEENTLLRRLFNYRFTTPSLKGHNLGNLILTALTDLLGSETEAIDKIGSIFEVKGAVVPITLTRKVHLLAQYANGKTVRGEKVVDEPSFDHDGRAAINRIWLEPQPKINPAAKKAIEEADLVIFGPGDFYTSVMPNTLVTGFTKALKNSKAKTVFVMNLINKYGQTFGLTTTNYLENFQKYTSMYPHYVLLNTAKLPKTLLAKYISEDSLPIVDNLPASVNNIEIIRTPLLAEKAVKTTKGDLLKRSLIRHDPDKLADQILKLINKADQVTSIS